MKQIIRRRGTAIVETKKGILVVSSKRKKFLLPGGGAKKWESRKRAAIRELKDETNLNTYFCKYLFTYNEPKLNSKGEKRKIVNKHKVFLIKTSGRIKVGDEVKYYTYYKNKKIHLSENTRKIIKKYLKNKPWKAPTIQD